MNWKCPHCQADSSNIRFSEKGFMIYKLNVEGGNLTYEQDEFAGDGGTFFCFKCNRNLDLTDDDVIEILAKELK